MIDARENGGLFIIWFSQYYPVSRTGVVEYGQWPSSLIKLHTTRCGKIIVVAEIGEKGAEPRSGSVTLGGCGMSADSMDSNDASDTTPWEKILDKRSPEIFFNFFFLKNM